MRQDVKNTIGMALEGITVSHRLFYILSLSIFLVGCAKDSSNSSEADPSDKTPDSSLMAGQGIMVGELTDQSAFVQVRLTQGDQLIERDLPGVPGL